MKQFFLMLAGTIILMTNACKTEMKPEQVATTFLDAMNNQQFDTARLYCTDSTMQLIDFLQGIAEMAKQEGSSFAKAEPVKDMKCNVTGDKAVCTFCCNGEGQSDEIDLIKTDKGWKINLPFKLPEEAAFESLLDTTYEYNPVTDSNEVIEDVEQE